MKVEILNDVEPNSQTVRRWGYDTHLLFIEQDEDLILGDVRYFPILLELAADSTCLKREYALDIVQRHCEFVIQWRHLELGAPIAKIASEYETSPSAEVREWAIWFRDAFAKMT
jgi:hypothetical protein